MKNLTPNYREIGYSIKQLPPTNHWKWTTFHPTDLDPTSRNGWAKTEEAALSNVKAAIDKMLDG